MTNFFNSLKDMQSIKEGIETAKQSFSDVSATGSAGGDLVQIKLSGNLMILSLKIDPSLLEAKDANMLEDLIIAAHDNAKDKINDIMKERLAPLAAQIRDL